MTWLILTNASPGATRNAGTQGDLTTLLDWALPQASWAIEYTGTNERVYRPSTGLRNRLYVNHNTATSGNAGLATVRGCENASSSSSLTDPFPLVSQIANNLSTWNISNSANTTDRPFRIYLSETFVFYFSNSTGTADQWDVGFFGDVEGVLGSDVYYTVCNIRNNSSPSAQNGITQTTGSGFTAGSNLFWMRDITGATKSTRGIVYTSGTSFGNVVGMPAARAGYQNRVYREQVGATDSGGTATVHSLGLLKRGWIPNLWSGLHAGKGSLQGVDTFTDTTYNPSASFRALSSSTIQFVIMEETDTWSPP
jgi:hypothetical protein